MQEMPNLFMGRLGPMDGRSFRYCRGVQKTETKKTKNSRPDIR